MHKSWFNRRTFVFAAMSLPGCTALNALNDVAEPRDTYDLTPPGIVAERRGPQTLLVVEPDAPAILATDRMLIRPQPLSVAYLPDARWSDDVPSMMQSLLIRSLSSGGQFGFVGPQGSGPIPDRVLLSRIDRFETELRSDGAIRVTVEIELTLLRDRDQSVLATRRFRRNAPVPNDQPFSIAKAFQTIMDDMLPITVDWIEASA